MIENEKREIVKGAKNVLKVQDQFYKELYKEDSNIDIDNQYIKTANLTKISETKKANMVRPITDNEIKKILWSMKLNKVPGNEGLTVEFYKFFWDSIGSLVSQIVKDAATEGFSKTIHRGLISLMEKPGKDQSKIQNWRPISLLNIDYKILSKILANRLNEILPDIIHSDQSGFMRGRSTSDNIFDLLAMLEAHKKNDQSIILTSYDFFKAFDTVSHSVLYRVMREFNIDDKFISMVKCLYKDIESCTINYGYTSEYFPIERGLRQGCALSAPCFNLLAELLGQKLRRMYLIRGRMNENIRENKSHAQYADDVWTLIIANQNKLNKCFDTFDEFSRQTGLVLNYNKTEMFRINSAQEAIPQMYVDKPIQWSEKI